MTYFVNGNNYGKQIFDNTLKTLKNNQQEFSVEDRYYWDAGKYKHLKDLIYGEWELKPVRI